MIKLVTMELNHIEVIAFIFQEFSQRVQSINLTHFRIVSVTGESLLEALILASTC